LIALRRLGRNPVLLIGVVGLALLVAAAALAPLLGFGDPVTIHPALRLLPPSRQFWFGTDAVGRDVFTRVVYGARVSLSVGLLVSAASTGIGLVLGAVSGYFRAADIVLMRIMDGLMAMPAILLAIAMISLTGASLVTVVVAIAVPQVPQIVRLVRSVVLATREELYVAAAIGVGTRPLKLVLRHILPATRSPLLVLATYMMASAVLLEATLSFIGAGVPPEIPSWGNMMAEGRSYFTLAPWMILFPGGALAVVVLSVNLLGDGLRDLLDPRAGRPR
jgi:peptide/nickel transport system permease protein